MGILTTLLATPCVGPYLGPVFGWVMTQPIWTAFLTFTVIGLGLGTPYLVIGAFPALIRFLPKPGEWMETLKEVMGFFFLGTVVWLFFCLPTRFFIPTLGLLVAMWFGCWLIGKTTLSGASREAQLTAWCVAIIVSALTGFVLFSLDLKTETGLPSGENETQAQNVDEDKIPWEKFSAASVEEALKKNQVVFIDFTARWCATCQTNGKFAINTPEVARFIREKNIQPLLADWSEPSEEIESALKSLNRNSIPLIVIWIPGEEQPILIDGLVTKGKVLRALEIASDRAAGIK
jgi:thiol:disulfide interchange protein